MGEQLSFDALLDIRFLLLLLLLLLLMLSLRYDFCVVIRVYTPVLEGLVGVVGIMRLVLFLSLMGFCMNDMELTLPRELYSAAFLLSFAAVTEDEKEEEDEEEEDVQEQHQLKYDPCLFTHKYSCMIHLS